MSMRANIAEVKVEYPHGSYFDGFICQQLKEFLEKNGLYIYSMENSDGGAEQWEIEKDSLKDFLENWDSYEFKMYGCTKDEMKEFLEKLLKSNEGQNCCFVHWF